jgi:S1-C subfamily serine protease
MPVIPPNEAGVAITPRSVWVFQEGIAGAKVETISEGLGRAVGVASGVLVIRAAPGTPAYESGLRDGDVILSAGGTLVSTVRELRGVLEQEGDEAGVKLVIVRERKQRDVTLRW